MGGIGWAGECGVAPGRGTLLGVGGNRVADLVSPAGGFTAAELMLKVLNEGRGK